HIEGKEQKRRFDAHDIKAGPRHRNGAERLSGFKDRVPKKNGIGGAAENFIASLAGIAAARQCHLAAEERRWGVFEITEISEFQWRIRRENIERLRPLQRQDMRIVILAE